MKSPIRYALPLLLALPAMAAMPAAPDKPITKAVKITEGGRVVRGDDEIDTDDYTQVCLKYDIELDKERKNAYITVRLDAYECNDDKTYNDTHLRLEKKLHLYEAPDGKTIREIADTPLTGEHSEFLRGERHGPQTFESRKVGGLEKITFTIDGKGRGDDDKMNFGASIDFIPKLY